MENDRLAHGAEFVIRHDARFEWVGFDVRLRRLRNRAGLRFRFGLQSRNRGEEEERRQGGQEDAGVFN